MERGGRGKAKKTKREDLRNIWFNWDEEYGQYSQCNDRLPFLSQFDVNILLSCLRFAFWPTRWEDVGRQGREGEKWAEILGRVECLEVKLVNCIDAGSIVEEIARLRAAISGEIVTVTNPDTGEPEIVNYTETGVVPTLLAMKTESLKDEVDDVEEILDSINTILGAAAILGAV